LRREAEKVLNDAKATAAKIINEANSIKADADKTRIDADRVLQRHELQLFAAQDRERAALASTQASRQAVAKAEAKEREFQTKIDRLREELRTISADWN
jgi:hypothetical protein